MVAFADALPTMRHCGTSCVLQVTDIRLITDRHTKRSKGLAYVEFSKQEEVFVALALTGMQQRAAASHACSTNSSAHLQARHARLHDISAVFCFLCVHR
jgi:hypothetical protein